MGLECVQLTLLLMAQGLQSLESAKRFVPIAGWHRLGNSLSACGYTISPKNPWMDGYGPVEL